MHLINTIAVKPKEQKGCQEDHTREICWGTLAACASANRWEEAWRAAKLIKPEVYLTSPCGHVKRDSRQPG